VALAVAELEGVGSIPTDGAKDGGLGVTVFSMGDSDGVVVR
jgi:hypothetical protein